MDDFESWLFDYESLNRFAQEKSEIYKKENPFPHAVIDQAANPKLLTRVLEKFPKNGEMPWFAYKNPLEIKLAQNTLELLPFVFKRVLWELNSGPFIRFLESLTGIQGLIPDPDFMGGGLHVIERGGKVDIHADLNFHKKLNLDRRVNVILYLNENWKDEYGGHLELWDPGMTQCKKVLPDFNRMICFSTTDWSYHGHPDPLTCPEGWSRKSIAVFYYTNGRPDSEKSAPHSSLYQKRPQDDSTLDGLRRRRALGRLEDLSR